MLTVLRQPLKQRNFVPFIFLVFFILVTSSFTNAQPVTFSSGSYLINLGAGVTAGSQSKDPGLRPYGLIYDMLKNFNVPIYVYIDPSKAKDGTDLIYNGNILRGGVFIIEKTTISADAQIELNKWFGNTLNGGKGLVSKVDVTTPLTLTPTTIFKAAPNWTLDSKNGSIALPYFSNAGIPATAHGGTSSSGWKAPSQLGPCDDIFVMPHADPIWSTHGNLFNWNAQYKGAIFAGCHAVGVLENMYNPSNIDQQTNFLSDKVTTSGPNIILPVPGNGSFHAQNSIFQPGNHDDGTPPYLTNTGTIASGTIATPSDPISQFIGVSDVAHPNGAQQIFFPVKGGGWRSSTRIVTWDPTPDTDDVPGQSDGPGAVIVYGRGFGNDNYGNVMYMGGHSVNKGSIGDVPAQRAFLNFSFFSLQDKIPTVSAIAGLPASNTFETFPVPQTYNLSVTYSSPIGAALQSVTWSAIRTDNGASAGTFSPNGTSSGATVFTPATVVGENVQAIITVLVTDVCGRTSFETVPVILKPSPRPPVALPAVKTLEGSCFGSGDIVTFDLSTVASDPDGGPLTYSLGVTGLVDGVGTWSLNGSIVTFVPVANFFGGAANSYTVCDNTSSLGFPPPDDGDLCAGSSISFSLGTADGDGCFPGSILGVVSTVGASFAPAGSQTATIVNPANALGLSDFDDEDNNTANATAALLDNSSGRLWLDYGSLIPASARDIILVSYARVNAAAVTITVEYSTNNTTWTTLGSSFSAEGGVRDLQQKSFDFPAGGLQYIRIGRTGGTSDDIWIDAVELEELGCVPSIGEVLNDNFTVREDTPLDLPVLANDINPQNKPVTVTIISNPTQGVAVVNSNNTIRYQPNKDNRNDDSFIYQSCTDDGACGTATVTLIKQADACDEGSGLYSPLDATESSFTLNPTGDSWFKEESNGDDIQNGGTGNSLEVGKIITKRRRAIMRFGTVTGTGTGQVPANATVTNATLRMVRTGGDGAQLTLGAYRVLPGSANEAQPWVETQVTWIHYQKNLGVPTGLWTNIGGLAGGTIAATPAATVVSPGTNGNRDFDITSMVQGWYSGTLPNYGVIVGQTTNVDKRHVFGSRENGTTGNRPQLTVTYRTEAPCITIPNFGPLARPDQVTTPSFTAITFDPRTNDFDYEGDALTITAVSGNPAGSSVSFIGSTVTYTPAPGSSVPRVEKFLYTVSDGTSTHQNWVNVTITNAAPVLVNKTTTPVPSGTPVDADVTAFGSDPEGQTLSGPVVTVEPLHGSYTINGNVITYTPITFNSPGSESYVGLDELTYERCELTGGDACNPVLLCSTAKIFFEMLNQPPVANPKTLNTGTCVPTNFILDDVISDPENQALTISITGGTEGPSDTWTFPNGTLVKNIDGSFTLTPNPGFPALLPGNPPPQNSGDIVIPYTVTDPFGETASNTVTITVVNPPVNQAPVAGDDIADPLDPTDEKNGTINQNIFVEILSNDYDPDGHDLEFNIPGGTGPNQIRDVYDANDPAKLAGTIEKFNNVILYKPAFNYMGTVNFIYQLCDIAPTIDAGCNNILPICVTADVQLIISNSDLNTPTNLNGTVWYDVDNSANGTFSNIFTAGEDGTGTNEILYAYLRNSSNVIVDRVEVGPYGKFIFNTTVPKNQDVTVFVSTTNLSVNDVVTVLDNTNLTLPAGWVNTSPFVRTVIVHELPVEEIDFGIQEAPIAGSGVNEAINPGGTIQVPVPANTFSNGDGVTPNPSTDAEGGVVTSIRITAFPVGATTIVIDDGNTATTYGPGDEAALAALIIPTNGSGEPLWQISVDPAALAAGTVTILFKAIDNGGFESLNVGTAVLNLTPAGFTLSGKVFNDTDGLTNGGNIDGLDYTEEDINAILIDNNGDVVGITAVDEFGNYSFTIVPDGTYSLLITNAPVVLGDDAPLVSLPTGWMVSGEDCCDNTGNDGTPDGILLGVIVSGANVANANFGIQQPPIAGSGVNSAPNPGGTVQVSVPANTFTNGDGVTAIPSADALPGEVTSIRITAFPADVTTMVIDGTSYNLDGSGGNTEWPLAGVVVPTDVDGNPTVVISVDPVSTQASTITISFVAIDNAGFESLNIGTAVLNLIAVPDLTPVIDLPDNVFTPNLTVNAVLYVNEIKGVSTVPGTAVFALTVPSGFKIEDFDAVLTQTTPNGGTLTNVQNNDFEVITQTPTFMVFKAKAVIAVNGSSFKAVGIRLTRTNALSQSVSVMTLGIAPDATGVEYDSNIINNSFGQILNSQ